MDGVTLILRARDAGLRLEVAGSDLKITGPKAAEPLVKLLAERKAQVLQALADTRLRKLRELRKIAPEEEGFQQSEEGGHRDDDAPYASALAALRARCPDGVPEIRWHQAVADATAFASEWGAEAQALGWTERALLGLHPAPDQPAANYSPLARLDDLGLIWLLRGRPVITLTKTGAIIRCPSGASVTYRRRTEPAPADIAERATT